MVSWLDKCLRASSWTRKTVIQWYEHFPFPVFVRCIKAPKFIIVWKFNEHWNKMIRLLCNFLKYHNSIFDLKSHSLHKKTQISCQVLPLPPNTSKPHFCGCRENKTLGFKQKSKMVEISWFLPESKHSHLNFYFWHVV